MYVCLAIKKNETLSLAIRWMELEDIMARQIIPAEKKQVTYIVSYGKARKVGLSMDEEGTRER